MATGRKLLWAHEAEKVSLPREAHESASHEKYDSRQQVLPFISLCEEPQIAPLISPFSREMVQMHQYPPFYDTSQTTQIVVLNNKFRLENNELKHRVCVLRAPHFHLVFV